MNKNESETEYIIEKLQPNNSNTLARPSQNQQNSWSTSVLPPLSDKMSLSIPVELTFKQNKKRKIKQQNEDTNNKNTNNKSKNKIKCIIISTIILFVILIILLVLYLTLHLR